MVAFPILFSSCKDDNEDCQLQDTYVQEEQLIYPPVIYDVRTDPPTEIPHDILMNALSDQWITHHLDDPLPFPYSEYFIDAIEFPNQSSALVHFFRAPNPRTYSYTQNECSLSLTSGAGDLHLELTEGGNEVTEVRVAIFDHSLTSNYVDTFTFVEFRLGPVSSYADVVRQFALDHPGAYDTVGIELVQNRTRE